ncbi:sensor histidine kinase [Undibacterium danionis]|uniref:histidine kinase n=1 Tax=Undibacterium danionis TaxID=1812100 RepID=A0ABV6IB35_9BURK
MLIHALKQLILLLVWGYWISNSLLSFLRKKLVLVGTILSITMSGFVYAETSLVTNAEIASGLQTRSSSIGVTWSSVTLSDVWRRHKPCREGHWTYRIPVTSFPKNDDSAAFVYRAGNRVHFYLDDQIIARYGDLFDSDSDYSNHAIIVSFPKLETTKNLNSFVYIQVAGDCRRYSGLSQVLIGSQQDLSALHAEKLRTFLWSTIAIIVICAILGFISLSAAILYRSSNALLFGIASALWALRAWLWSMHDLSIPYSYWFFLIDLCFGIWMSLICILALRVNQIRSKWLEKAQWLSLGIFLLSSIALIFGAPPVLKALGIDLIVVAGAFALLSIARQSIRKPSPSNIAVALAGLLMLIVGLYDHWNVWISDAADAYQRFYFTPLIVLFFILAIGIVLNLRYVHAIRSDAQYRHELEVEVAKQRELLEHHHQEMTVRAKQEAISLERGRIMKDMHDGLGSQLVGLMSLVQTAPTQHTEIEFELQQVIDTLRATIDTLSPSGDDLTTVLAQFRFRYESRLKRLKIQLHWRVKPFHTINWTSNELIQFEHMIREIFANIIKHAQASEIFVEAGGYGLYDRLIIRDNGRGFNPLVVLGGRGLGHLHERAKDLEIQLSIDSEIGDGTAVCLQWKT